MTRRQHEIVQRNSRFAAEAHTRAVDRLINLHRMSFQALLREADAEVRNESAQEARSA